MEPFNFRSQQPRIIIVLKFYQVGYITQILGIMIGIQANYKTKQTNADLFSGSYAFYNETRQTIQYTNIKR